MKGVITFVLLRLCIYAIIIIIHSFETWTFCTEDKVKSHNGDHEILASCCWAATVVQLHHQFHLYCLFLMSGCIIMEKSLLTAVSQPKEKQQMSVKFILWSEISQLFRRLWRQIDGSVTVRRSQSCSQSATLGCAAAIMYYYALYQMVLFYRSLEVNWCLSA